MPGNDFSRMHVGIIGGGHLGRALALALPRAGIRRDRIRISHAGNPETGHALYEAGLSGSVSDNAAICAGSDIIFLCVRPQSVLSLAGLVVRDSALVVSCMAGITVRPVSELLGIPVVRMMPSGPETLTGHNGIVAVYPESPVLSDLLAGIGQTVCPLKEESQMDVFTAGVCLPAILLFLQLNGRDANREIRPVIREYPLMVELYSWGTKATPKDLSTADANAYIARMSTKGGITEAIITSLGRGEPLETAFRAGVSRCAAVRRESGFFDL